MLKITEENCGDVRASGRRERVDRGVRIWIRIYRVL